MNIGRVRIAAAIGLPLTVIAMVWANHYVARGPAPSTIADVVSLNSHAGLQDYARRVTRASHVSIRDSEDFATAPVIDAMNGDDNAAIYFVGANEQGYTILRDVMRKDNINVGYIYVDPRTGGIIVQIDNYRIGVR